MLIEDYKNEKHNLELLLYMLMFSLIFYTTISNIRKLSFKYEATALSVFLIEFDDVKKTSYCNNTWLSFQILTKSTYLQYKNVT